MRGTGGQMMSILIKGMEMPQEAYKDIRGTLWKDGRFTVEDNNTISTYKAIEVSTPHGRLIDGDMVYGVFIEMSKDEWNKKNAPVSWAIAFEEVAEDIVEAPTVIEAEEDK